MGKKSTPPPPDYTGAAREQAAASSALTDKQTEQNRPDIITPWGKQTWTQDANNPDKWQMNVELSPDQQAALDDQQKIQAGRSQGALQLLDQATQSFQSPVDYSSLPQGGQEMAVGGLQGPGPAFSFGGPQRPMPTDVDYNQVSASAVGGGGGSSGPLKFQMDRTAGDWRQKGQDAALAFQQPLIERRRSQLENQLANMGLTRGSEAWNAEMQRDSDQAMRDNLQAFGAGQSEANMLFNQDLQSSQFTNAARGQEFNQSFQNAQLGQQAQLANAQMGLQAQMANNDNAFRAGDFALRSGGQQFNQDLARGQYYQNAVDQNDRRQMQDFSMRNQANNYNQNLRQAMLNERLAQRSQPLNELNALLTGQQVQNPNMPNFNAAGKGETPDLMGAMNAGYQGQLDSMNSARGLFGQLASGGLMSAAMFFSDRRLKEDIEYIGASIGGVPVVHYRYRGLPGRRIGVIAQDVARVKPHAVSLDPSGYLKVNLLELCE